MTLMQIARAPLLAGERVDAIINAACSHVLREKELREAEEKAEPKAAPKKRR